MKKTKKSQSISERLVLAVVFGLPLACWPFHMAFSKPMKWGLLVTLLAAVVVLPEMRQRLLVSVRQLNRLSKSLLALLVILIVVSTLFGASAWTVRIIGWDSEYLGLLSWLGFVVLAITMCERVKLFLTSRTALAIAGAVVLLSFVIDGYFVYYGMRLTGVLQQATSMGMYAAFALLLSVWHMSYQKYTGWLQYLAPVVAWLSVLAVLLSQSRIAQFTALLCCLIVMVSRFARVRKVQPLAIVMVVALFAIPAIAQTYFSRLRTEQVQEGLSYRAEIYRTSFHDVLSGHYVTGLGASGVPVSINSRSAAPAGLVESLDKGFVFLSAHDIFLDVAICFGMIAGMALLVLVLQALWNGLREAEAPEGVLLGCAFLVLLLNALCNVPSLEMTLLFFVGLVALLPSRSQKSSRRAVS